MSKIEKQKIEEKEIFNKFFCSEEGIKWFGENKIKKIENYESPDFLFKTESNKIVGMEIVSFILESNHQKYTQLLTRMGNQVIHYIQKKYNLGISITIEQHDRKLWSPKWQDHIESAYNQGFSEIPKIKTFKEKMIKILESNIEKLKRGGLAQGTISNENEYYEIRASFDKSVCSKKYNCHVNNTGKIIFDPFNELQDFINKKNNKYKNYKKNAQKCYLLIFVPDSKIGNYCCFSENILKTKFISEFDETFLLEEESEITYKLFTKSTSRQ